MHTVCNCGIWQAQHYHVCQANYIAHDAQPGEAKKLSSSFTLNNDESVVLQKLSLNVHSLCLVKNPLLFLLSVRGELIRECGRQPWLANNAITVE